MQKNMGNIDRILRIGAGAIIAVMYLVNTISGSLEIILGIVALVFVATSLFGICPLYSVLKVSTGPVQSKKNMGVAQ